MNRLGRSLEAFCRDRRAQMAFLTIVGLIPITALMFSIVNSGSTLQDATRSQDAADMIALVHAAEGARSMNTLAMNHVSLTQNYTTAVHASTLDDTITIHLAVLTGAILEANLYIADTCGEYPQRFGPKVGGILFGICAAPTLTYIGELVLEVDRTLGIRSDYRPEAAYRVASDALRALNAQNREIYDRFPQAVFEQAGLMAEAHRIDDLYFDESCARGVATSCDPANPRQGMELPVTINEPMAAYLGFCSGLFFGTGGLATGHVPLLGDIPGLSILGSTSLMNGSFERRLFPLNEGPMYGGAANGERYLPIHVSRTSGIGQALEDYQDMAHETRMYDGVINVLQTPTRIASFAARLARRILLGRSTGGIQRSYERRARSILDYLIIGGTSTAEYGGPGLAYPMDQTRDRNIFTIIVEARVAAQCAGLTGQGSGFGDQLVGFVSRVPDLFGLSEPMPQFDLYHPVQGANAVGGVVTILPGIDDFPDDYRPLAFVFRESNDRWAPNLFIDPNEGFVRYAQSIIFNPDELSMFSQNWRARLIPATRLLDRQAVLDRMEGEIPESMQEFRRDLEAVGDVDGWDLVVTR